MKKILTFFMSLVLVLCVGYSTPVVHQTAPIEVNAGTQAGGLPENYLGADFSHGEIAYILDRPIDVTLNTFSALIRMEKNHHTTEYKSVIFGSY